MNPISKTTIARHRHFTQKVRKALLNTLMMLVLVLISADAAGQAIGDYRTRASGNWNAASTWERYNGSIWVRQDATFPIVAGTASSAKTSTSGTTHVVSLPAGITAGDLLLIFWADATANAVDPGTPSGWTQLYSTTTGGRFRKAWYKIADGFEGESLSITYGTAGERSAHTSYRIAAGSYQGVPVVPTNPYGQTSSTTLDPPSLISGFGATNTLWIAAAGSTGDNNNSPPTPPANYTSLVTAWSGGTGTDHCRAVSAHRNLNAATEDPGPFTVSSAVAYWANTVAIRSVAVTGVPSAASNVITIRSGHNVAITASTNADQCIIESGAQVTVNSGQIWTIADGAGTDLTINGTLVNAGTLTFNGQVICNANSTVVYSGTTAQTVQPVSSPGYGNLILSGSGTKTFGGVINTATNLSIASGVVANLGTLTHNAETLTLGGTGVGNGTWGHSNSNASNKNDTWFAAATGILNVNNSSCTYAPSASATKSDVKCFNGNDGTITITASGGTAPYMFSINNGTSYVAGDNPYTFSGLSAGDYYPRVKDANGCESPECE